MNWNKSKTLIDWFSSLSLNYKEFINKSKNFRYKIVDIEIDKKTNEATLFIMINGIRKQIIPFSPANIVTNDTMLNEFSSFDVRAITFYALTKEQEQIQSTQISHYIFGQEFLDGKTIFIVKNIDLEGEERRSAHELYCDNKLLTNFNRKDLKIIISTAIQEQAIEDFQKIGE